jgi:GGDEF domain-containing protein
VTELELIVLLAETARELAAPDAPPDALAAAAARVSERSGLTVDLHRLADPRPQDVSALSPAEAAFLDALGSIAALAASKAGAGEALLDSPGFQHELDRLSVAARWRGQNLAVAVFDVLGMALGPGVDEGALVAHVGAVCRSVVRAGDLVAHLGAGQFALLFPRAGTFEARAAMKRVRTAVQHAPLQGTELLCGAAGFAELHDVADQDEILREARVRLAAARLRSSYVSPSSPTTPLAG